MKWITIDIGFSEVFYIVLHMAANFKSIDNYESEQMLLNVSSTCICHQT